MTHIQGLQQYRGGMPLKKYYKEPKDNAAFDRCINVMTNLIQKYGAEILDEIEQKNSDVNISKIVSMDEMDFQKYEQKAA